MKSFNKNVIPMHQIGFPIDTNFIPKEDDPVRLLFNVTEGLNYKKLYETYSTLGRNPVVEPIILFRIIIYGYINKLYSSREIEKACKRDINFIWLLQGQKAPDHNTIARFRVNHLEKCIDGLFNQLVIKLGEMNEIEYKNIFIDGTKVETNAINILLDGKRLQINLRISFKKRLKISYLRYHQNLKLMSVKLKRKYLLIKLLKY